MKSKIPFNACAMKKLPRTQFAIVVSGLAVATVLLLAPSSKALSVSYSASAPTVDGEDIANFTGSTTDAGNVNSGNDAGTYVASDKPALGQTFTTGANAGGYILSSITLQQVAYTSDTTYMYLSDVNANFNLRLGTVVGTVFTQIGATESAATTSGAGFGGTHGYNGFSSNGSGEYITFTLDAPVTLAANTTYGFDVGISGGNGYFETNGTSADAYASGFAYTSGTAGAADLTATVATGDHVFHLDMVAVPEPATYAIFIVGLCSLLILRRRRA